MQTKRHYGDKDGLLLLSYDAVISCVLSNRNYGKTWTFKRRAWRRFLKHGRKTIWLRMFRKEARECSQSFYNSVDLQKYCGVSFYDKETNPNGNIKQEGRTIYGRRSPRHAWQWFIKIHALSEADAIRSADDVKIDTIVFDEVTKTTEKYKRYRGDIATDFIDILFSLKREHKVNCILLGNKESVSNPIFTYFGIKPLPYKYEGIKAFKGGSFVIQQINNVQTDETKNIYDRKVDRLLNGTKYGDYITKSTYKNASAFKQRKAPATASLYVQLVYNNALIKIVSQNGYFYINQRVEESKRIFCDVMPHKYRNENLLVRKHRRYFDGLVEALADNRVYYDNATTYEATQAFLQWLCV